MIADPTPLVDPRALGKLLLLQTTLHAMQTPEQIGDFVARGLQKLPGVVSVTLRMRGADGSAEHVARGEIGDAASARAGDGLPLSIPIASVRRVFGSIELDAEDGAAFLAYRPFVESLANTVALTIENRAHERALSQLNEGLESAVRDRTADLRAANENLRREIGERKLAKTALREGEARFRRLVQLMPIPLALVDAQSEMQYLNDRFSQVFGYTMEDIPTFHDWWHRAFPDAEYRAAVKARFAAAAEKAALTNSLIRPDEYRITCRDGTLRDVEVSGIGFDGELLATFVDLTDRKREEAALQTLQKLESLGTLAGGIAHDFNNVLTGILGNLSMLSERATDTGDESDLVREAIAASLTARGLAQQLLTFSSGGNPISANIDVAPLLRIAAGFAARGSGARCVIDTGDQPLPVYADKDQLTQIVQNLVINASQAMPDGGTITVHGALVDLAAGELPPLPGGRYVRCQVRDDGVGIPEANLPRIFDPYFTTKSKGHGLGLAVCHSIVVKHGGHIGVESRPGAGTCFTLHLPAIDPSAVAASACPAPVRTGSGRVLVMDDDVQVSRVLRRMLERLGYRVECTADGAAAIAAYASADGAGDPFGLVIMDLTIAGGMGGREAMTRLRVRFPEVRAVVSSGYGTDPVMADASIYGFRGVLAKPYRLEDVSRVVAAVTHGARIALGNP